MIIMSSGSGLLLCQMKGGSLLTKKVCVSLTGAAGDLLKEASVFCEAPSDQLIISYQGRTIMKTDQLDQHNIAEGGVIMVAQIPATDKIKKDQSVTLTPEDIRKFVVAFKTALKSPSFSKVVKRLVEKENMDNLSAACPGLSDDLLAQSFLTRPDLLAHLCDPEILKKMAETHPCLLEAANNLAAAVHEEEQSSSRTAPATAAATEAGSYYLDEMSDEEMETDEAHQRVPRQVFSSISAFNKNFRFSILSKC